MTKKDKAVEAKKSIWDMVPVHGRFVPLDRDTLEPMDTYLTIAGLESEECQQAKRVMAYNDFKAAFDESKLSEFEKFDIYSKRKAELAGRCIVGWDEESFGPFSTDKAVELMNKLPWLFAQVEKFLEDRVNFMKA